MTGRHGKQWRCKPTYMSAQDSALTAVTSNSAFYTPPAPRMTVTVQSDAKQPSSYCYTSTMPTVASFTTSIPDGYHGQPLQAFKATYNWSNIISNAECGPFISDISPALIWTTSGRLISYPYSPLRKYRKINLR